MAPFQGKESASSTPKYKKWLVCLLLGQRCMIQLQRSGSWVHQEACRKMLPNLPSLPSKRKTKRGRWEARPRAQQVHVDTLVHIFDKLELSLLEAQSNDVDRHKPSKHQTGPRLCTSVAQSLKGETHWDRELERRIDTQIVGEDQRNVLYCKDRARGSGRTSPYWGEQSEIQRT